MKEETTARLTEILSRTEGDKAGQKFAAEHSVEMGFSQYFCEFLAFRNMVLAEVVKKSGINKNYVYQIVNGSKNPSRDKVIALCIAAGMNFSETIPEKGSSTEAFDMNLVNVLIDGTFKGGKEDFRIMLDPLQRKNAPYMGSLFQDLYVETHRIKNTSILVGNSRVGVGMEGNQSPYTLSFVNRSQIARNFSNVRKFGVRVRGDYDLVDYDAGIYSSSTNFTSFFPGHEANVWLNIKPLGKTDGKYGRLITGGGLSSGEKHGTDYFVSGAYVGYDYKRFWVKAEYARANGSNGRAGLTNNRAQGFFATAGYFLTKKIELLARYDQFDSDRNIADNTRREYTIGSNYYLKGQALKLIFNYIY